MLRHFSVIYRVEQLCQTEGYFRFEEDTLQRDLLVLANLNISKNVSKRNV